MKLGRQHTRPTIAADASVGEYAAARAQLGDERLRILLDLTAPGKINVGAAAARAVCYARESGPVELVCQGASLIDASLLARVASAAYIAGASRISLDLDPDDELLAVVKRRCPAARPALAAVGSPRPARAPLDLFSWARNRARRRPALVASPIVESGR